MIASRKLDRLSASAKLLQQQIKPESTAELDHVQCNIRNEEQVLKKWAASWQNQDLRSECAQWVAEDPMFLHVDSKDSDHDKTNKMICALSEESDKPGLLSSLIKVFVVSALNG